MLVRRGADAAREDKNKCEPSFIARRVRAFECRQIISQHLLERTERLSREANNVYSRIFTIILEGEAFVNSTVINKSFSKWEIVWCSIDLQQEFSP